MHGERNSEQQQGGERANGERASGERTTGERATGERVNGDRPAGERPPIRFQVTEVRIKLSEAPRNKLRAYASVTIDDAFVVRDLKIIDGNRGPFIAMPSRKLADHCPRCHHKNHLRAAYCNQCGGRLDPDRASKDDRGRARLHADLAHPINSTTRIELHKAVVRAYSDEVEAAQRAGSAYRPKSFDDLDDLSDTLDAEYIEELERRQGERERRRREGAGSGEMMAGGAH